jgi:hypothetical protein
MAGDYKASGPMLDSRRDCRYRRGAHRSIGVGLGKVTFHDMSGPQEEIPGFPLTLIHPSVWEADQQKHPSVFLSLGSSRASSPMGLRAWLSEEKAGGVMARPFRARTIESARLFTS